jgi:MSHA biogenesis protein MshP
MRQRGLAIVNAIFLIVVLAALAAAVATLSKVEHDTGAKSLLSAKVYYGAKSGLDWGIQQAIAAGSCAGSTSFTLTQAALAGVNVTVTCSTAAYAPANVHYLVSTATTGSLGSLGYAERRLEATVCNTTPPTTPPTCP